MLQNYNLLMSFAILILINCSFLLLLLPQEIIILNLVFNLIVKTIGQQLPTIGKTIYVVNVSSFNVIVKKITWVNSVLSSVFFFHSTPLLFPVFVIVTSVHVSLNVYQ